MASCVYCDRAALDGHLTCGAASCPESTALDDAEGFWLAAHLGARSTVHLADGRVIDVTGLSFTEATARLRTLAVGLDDVRETRHVIPLKKRTEALRWEQ